MPESSEPAQAGASTSATSKENRDRDHAQAPIDETQGATPSYQNGSSSEPGKAGGDASVKPNHGSEPDTK